MDLETLRNEIKKRDEEIVRLISERTELAKQVGVPTPLMDSVANLASALRDENYWETGRTLDKVGLAGMTKEEIKEFLVEGYKD